MSVRAQIGVARGPAPLAAVVTAVLCQVVAVTAGAAAGAACDAVLLLALVNVCVFAPERDDAPALMLVGLVVLTRLASLALPTSGLSRIARDAIVAVLALVGLATAAGQSALDYSSLRLRRAGLRSQLAIAAAGIPLGLVAWWMLDPSPLARPGRPAELVAAVLVLALLVAPALELLFRWALQPELLRLYGGAGLALLNVLFASLYLGTQSAGYIVLLGFVGLGLSLGVRRTGCVWGAVAAHGLLAIGLLIVWPAVLG